MKQVRVWLLLFAVESAYLIRKRFNRGTHEKNNEILF